MNETTPTKHMNSIHPITQIHFIIFNLYLELHFNQSSSLWKIFNYNALCTNYDDEDENYVDDGVMRLADIMELSLTGNISFEMKLKWSH